LVTDLFYLAATGISSMTNAYLLYGFHDVNGKFTWSPEYRNTFSGNFYQGDDYFQIFSKKPKHEEDGRFRKGNIWGNWLGSVNWNHAFPSNWMLKNTVSFTHYRVRDVLKISYNDKQIEKGMENFSQLMQSSLQDISWRSEASYTLMKNWDLEFGKKLSHLRFKPMIFKHNSVEMSERDETVDALESAIYVSNKIKPLDFLDAEIGLRGVTYVNTNITNFSFEPRLSTNIYLTENHVLNLSAMRVSQNAQLIGNIGSLAANEIYVPSGKDIPVSYSNQFSFGYHTSFSKKKYQVEANVYHKTLKDLTTYKDGYGYSMGDIYWRDKLETGGTGLAQGFEFLFKKSSGRLTGFVGYTYSKSTRQFDGINNGKTYEFEHSSPHDLSINLALQLSEKWSFGATWQYQSGLPFTPAIGRYNTIDEDGSLYEVLIFGDKNSDRMRDYHRLDIAFKKKTYTKKKYREGNMRIKAPNRKSELTLGVYNVYARQNPYYYFYNNTGHGGIFWYENTDGAFKLYQVSMFSLIPMISYKVWFGADSKKW
jgi:hypothetical protein